MEEPDLVILDVMLPGKNGYEVARMLREDARKGACRDCRILMLTARKVDSAERLEFLQTWSGADLHLYKPLELEALIEAVRTLIGD
jgi:DNA-binding response OmpR family regulator